MELKLASKTKDGILIVDCSGRIVFGEESSLLRDKIKKAIVENNRIVLNLGEVSYIDSGGLGPLVGLRATAINAGGADQAGKLDQARRRLAAGNQVADGLRCLRLRGRSHRVFPGGRLAA